MALLRLLPPLAFAPEPTAKFRLLTPLALAFVPQAKLFAAPAALAPAPLSPVVPSALPPQMNWAPAGNTDANATTMAAPNHHARRIFILAVVRLVSAGFTDCWVVINHPPLPALPAVESKSVMPLTIESSLRRGHRPCFRGSHRRKRRSIACP